MLLRFRLLNQCFPCWWKECVETRGGAKGRGRRPPHDLDDLAFYLVCVCVCFFFFGGGGGACQIRVQSYTLMIIIILPHYDNFAIIYLGRKFIFWLVSSDVSHVYVDDNNPTPLR